MLVFVHELGHYLSARRHGIKIEMFSIGFGPEVVGWTDKNSTRWRINAIPLGGYVKMFGDENSSSYPDYSKLNKLPRNEAAMSFFHRPVWERIEVAAAGPIANYIFSIIILSVLFMTVGQTKWDDQPKIGSVITGSVAEDYGFIEGDTILSINSIDVNSFKDIGLIIKNNHADNNKKIEFVISRPNENLVKKISVEFDNNQSCLSLGIVRSQNIIVCNPFVSIAESCKYSLDISVALIKGIIGMIVGDVSTKGLSGPLGIAQISEEISHQDWPAIFSFISLLSINLGLLNLLPIPMLDGGHLLFYFIELVRGKPVSKKVQEVFFRIGFLLIILLFFHVTFNDFARFFGK